MGRFASLEYRRIRKDKAEDSILEISLKKEKLSSPFMEDDSPGGRLRAARKQMYLVDLESTLRERIIKARLYYGYTKREFAGLLGISERTLYEWEHELRIPPEEQRVRVCQEFRVNSINRYMKMFHPLIGTSFSGQWSQGRKAKRTLDSVGGEKEESLRGWSLSLLADVRLNSFLEENG
ncbi:helix-turn-helix transcriptional regulator [Brevibacillus sp. MER 51]|uniref:helix-turn-helix transcriptional regulator n=1 Tax=Brevibacillus sp. MER 51 TaxID=2939560 RepID=UPI00203D7000|nr:helix-turn-helix transcriptional regulator [Brevibacillus sp. MER 51]MCM3141486.1 helix-turn-helix domain-containing protein [Brevibacillus sp. MER 51]